MDELKHKVGVIFGGMSAENEVSLATGRYVYSLLDPQKFQGIPFYLDKNGGLWQVPDKLVIQNTIADVESRLEKEAQKIHFEDLKGKVDLVFNALLGKYGEDGCIQGVLELSRIPYTGSGILASALGMDKKTHKKMLAAAGFNVARDFLVQSSLRSDSGQKEYRVQSEVERWKSKIEETFGFPCVIKPTREGSSMGVSVVKNPEGLNVAFEYASKYDNEVLVEEYLRGLEYTCVVWGNKEPKAMLPTEIVFEGDFFTYEGKYMPGRAQTITPARVSPEILSEIQKVAVEVYKLIGCVGYGRVDGFVVGQDIYVTEPHTGSIMVPSSFVFQQASQFKISLDDRFTGKKVSTPLTPRMLVSQIVEMASEAHRHKKGLL